MKRIPLNKVPKDDLMKIKASLAYWLDIDLPEKLLKDPKDFLVEYARTEKIRRLYKIDEDGQKLYFTFRPYDFYPVPTIESAKVMNELLPPIRLRVVVDDEQVPFVKEKKSILNSLVLDIDTSLRNGDYVLIVDKTMTLLGIGKLNISPLLIKELEHGFGITVKDSV